MNSFIEPRRVSPGCQHQLGCKCAVPYHLRPSSPEEEIAERAIQLSGRKLHFIETALRVVERRRDELKSELLRLRPPVTEMVEGDL